MEDSRSQDVKVLLVVVDVDLFEARDGFDKLDHLV